MNIFYGSRKESHILLRLTLGPAVASERLQKDDVASLAMRGSGFVHRTSMVEDPSLDDVSSSSVDGWSLERLSKTGRENERRTHKGEYFRGGSGCITKAGSSSLV